MSRFFTQRLGALSPYTPGEQPRDMQYIKLNTNEAPFPPAPSVVAAMNAKQVEDLRLYSDPTGKGLKEKLAGLYGLMPENIFLSNGSDDILNFAFMAFGQDGAVFPDITYGFYPVYGVLHGIPCQQIPLNADFTLDYTAYCGVNKLVVIANPNAPTGLSISVAQIEEILKSNPNNVVVIDEAYVDFGGKTCYSLLKKYDNLLVVRTFSKSRCMAGGRLGYAMGDAGIIADLEKIKFSTNPYNVNRLTLMLGEATVDAESYYQDMCAEIIRVREYTIEALRKLGFTVLPSDANFIFAKSDKIDGGELYLQLKKRGILIRHFTAERICQYNRITIGTREQMETFIETVKLILSNH